MSQVIVYKNLNLSRGDRTVWSIAAYKSPRSRGKLIRHATDVTLSGVTFVVIESSRQEVIRLKTRSVHAWAVGTLEASVAGAGTEITYSPYRGGTFTTRDGKPVARADYVRFSAQAVAVGSIE